MPETIVRKHDLALEIERVIEAPRAVVWRCWTEAGLLKQWFCPRPWAVPEADLDARPGGRMNLVMTGPDGERIETTGSFLEVVPRERLVFTDAYAEGFVPRPDSFMTAYVRLSDEGGGTRMVWGARHASTEQVEKHLAMGFEAGWPVAAAQLDDLARGLATDGNVVAPVPYIDGFLLAVPTANKEAFRAHAAKAAALFREYGARRVVECWGDDVPEGEMNSMRTAVLREEGETVVFSWVAWPDKACRDAGWAAMMADPRMQALEAMPFDGKRMIFGGFDMIVDA